MRDAGCLRDLRPGRHLRGDHPRDRRAPWSTSTPASTSAAWSATSSSDLERIPDAGDGRLIAFLGGTIGNLYPDAAPRVPVPDRGAARSRRPPPARHRPGQGRRPASRPPTTTPAASPPSSTRTCSRSSTASSAPTSTSTPSSTSPATTPREERMDIRLRSLADQSGPARRARPDVEFAAGEEMRTEISTKFTRERLESVYARRRPGAARLVHRRRRRLRAEPAPAARPRRSAAAI